MQQTTQKTDQQKMGPTHSDFRFHIGTGASQLVTLSADSPISEAVRLMKDHHIGDVIITEDRDGELFPLGIVTDRDLTIEVMARGGSPERLTVSEVMSKELATCNVGAGIFEMIRTMKEQGVTRLPLVNERGALKGIVNAKNLIQLLTAGLHDLSHISVKQIENELDMKH